MAPAGRSAAIGAMRLALRFSDHRNSLIDSLIVAAALRRKVWRALMPVTAERRLAGLRSKAWAISLPG